MHRFDIPRRSLIAIDLENLAGKPRLEAGDAFLVMNQLERALRIESSDHVVIAANPGNAFVAEIVRQGLHGSIRLRHGHNGADLALIEALEVFLEQDFKRRTPSTSRVVVCSGDGIFADIAKWARDVMGLSVLAVTQADRLSQRLLRACGEVRYLPGLSNLPIAS